MVPLLGWQLLTLLAVLLVLVTVATVRWWASVRGPWPARFAQRFGLLVVGQVLGALLLAAAANNYGYFYGSWHDLLGVGGSDLSGVTVVRSGAATGSDPSPAPKGLAVLPPRGWRVDSWGPRSAAKRRGLVMVGPITGPRTGLSTAAYVYLPPAYFSSDANRRFPAAVVFTGYPGSALNLVRHLDYGSTLVSEMKAGRARPMILVMMDPDPILPRDAECTNIAHGPQVETYLTSDVQTVIGREFRVKPGPWGAVGDSTGGYCAVKLALRHPHQYDSAVALSGYYHPLHDATTGDLWGGSTALRDDNDPEWLLAHRPQPPVSLMLTTGALEGGPNGVSDARKFMALVRAPLDARLFIVPDRGHNYADWRTMLPRAVDFLSDTI